MQWLRSLVFVVQIYLMIPILAVFFTPLAVIDRKWALAGMRSWCLWVRWTAGWMVGLRSEIRGTVPTDEVLIASKHQSFFDTIIIVSEVPSPKFIMKASLKWAPIVGWYAQRIGCIPVNRGRRAEAIKQMKAGVDEGRAGPGQLVIYPQGTRVAPGAYLPYKIGAGVLYEQLAQPCIPAATNVGVFWPRTGIARKPGLAVVEFLDPIPPGLPVPDMMADLEERIEAASTALMREAGFAPAAKGPAETA